MFSFVRLSVVGGLALITLLASARVPGQTSDSGWGKHLDALIEKGMAEYDVPGLAVGIVLDGKLAYARGFGQTTLGQPTAVTPDTLFHMASVTKPFVATAIMQMVEQGKLALDDPVTKHLPYFRLDDPRYQLVTIRQLLNHTSGMPDVKDYEWNKPQDDEGALERYIRSLKSEKLLWDPGTRFAYSNIGFEILGEVIAKVSGMSFDDYIERQILKPVGMSSSTLLLKRADTKRVANGYTKGNAAKQGASAPVPVAAYPYNRPHNPSSGLLSSVNDMARWAMVNLNYGKLDGKRILNSSTYDLMWKPTAEVEFCRGGPCRKPGSSVGLSWFLEEKDGRLIVSHGGGDDGFISAFVLIPSRKFAFVMMTNSDSAGIPLLKQIQAEALSLAK
ncbi:MAG TPA: serine hydrolase domain-containing protein [Pyrinomonadaceae bacterium]